MTILHLPMNAAGQKQSQSTMKDQALLGYYEAIERASDEMLQAARRGDWDHVVKLEGACAVLISQLKHAAVDATLAPEEVKAKGRIMRRILINDAQIRNLAEPWIDDLDLRLSASSRSIH